MIQDLVKDIHSTLKNYSVGLEQQNYLLEKAWTLVDGNLNVHRLIFKKKGVLRAFKNGNLEDNCTWDYEPSINSLIIKIGNEDGIVLNKVFLDGKVLILRKDNTYEFWVFIDNTLLQGDYLEDYLRKKISSGPDGNDSEFIYPGKQIVVFIVIILFFLLLIEILNIIF
jgi:hypothetical protein